MNDRVRAAADRIREHVSIIDVLVTYGYDVRADGGDREQQFRCDLHGTGRDDKPSARVYPDSNTWYCFACDKTRDPIETVRAKEGNGFWEAVRLLEDAYGLEPLPIDYGIDRVGDSALATMAKNLDDQRTFEDEEKRVRTFLDGLTKDRDIPLDTLLRFWEGFDKLVYRVRGPRGDGGTIAEPKGKAMMVALLGRFIDEVKEHYKRCA